MEIRNQKLSDKEFFREREQVLATWPTGRDVDINEAVEYHHNMPVTRIIARKLEEAKRNGTPLNFTHSGTPILEWQIGLLKRLQDEGKAGILSTHVDSLTRNQFYDKASQATQESQRTGKALLNGFPIPVHGVTACRKIIESVNTPIMITGTSCDWRFTSEIGLAGGYTASTGDPFFCYFCYNKNTTLETSIRNWQYIYRLRGYYEENGCPFITKPEGSQCNLCPSSIEDALRIISLLLAAEQGCKHFLVMILGRCHLAQDLANAIILPKLAREYLDRFGYKDTVVFSGIQGWQGRHPLDRSEALAVISLAPLVATLARLQVCGLFTVDEAHEIPTPEGQIVTLKFGNVLVNMLKDQIFDIDSEQVKTEARMNELETRSIVDKVIEMGEGDVAVGAIKAVEAGVLDTPFSTSRYVARKVLGVRDADGAGRYFDTGNLPFSNEIKEFHKLRISERSNKQGKEVCYDTIVKDLLSISDGYLVG